MRGAAAPRRQAGGRGQSKNIHISICQARLGWPAADLALRRKGAAGKVCWAARLRRETTMSLQWIASERRMGSWAHIASLLAAIHLVFPICVRPRPSAFIRGSKFPVRLGGSLFWLRLTRIDGLLEPKLPAKADQALKPVLVSAPCGLQFELSLNMEV